jgi:hypothetical protein
MKYKPNSNHNKLISAEFLDLLEIIIFNYVPKNCANL